MWRIRPISGVRLARYADLLLALDAGDRRLRFGRSIADEAVRDHVAGLDPRGVLVIALFADEGLLGAAEIAPDGAATEIALVVARTARRRGLARRLLRAALAVARGSEARVRIAAENGITRRLAARGGFTLRTGGGELLGVRPLERRPPRHSLGPA